jgi:glycosyltransferase involved in cell wall biosynthesis
VSIGFKRYNRHIVFVQYGDYAEAVRRFAAGGKEDYFAQKYTVDYVAGLAASHESVTVITFSREHPFELLPNGVGAEGILLYPPGKKARHSELIHALEARRPTDLVLVSPIHSVLRWAVRTRVPTLPLFADSFLDKRVKSRLKAWILARELNHSHFRWVANHSAAAAQDLARIGVNPSKILPFDWPPTISPSDFPPKEPPTGLPFRLLYVGQLSEAKGIGDAVSALSSLTACTLGIVGWGSDEDRIRSIIERNGIASRVIFHGRIPHDQVLEQMRMHDAVLVPSRHEYPEGLPMTIYEAFCSRTPVIASDHPMFLQRLVPDGNALIFEASKPASLSAAVSRLLADPELYRSLSRAAGEAAGNYLCPLKWHDLIGTWLKGGTESDTYLRSFALGGNAVNI